MWVAFHALSDEREWQGVPEMVLDGTGQMRGMRSRFHPAPIPILAIVAYLDEMEMPRGDDRRRFVSLVKSMDGAFRAHIRKQDKIESKSTPGARRPNETRWRPTYAEQEAAIARIRAEKAAAEQEALSASEAAD